MDPVEIICPDVKQPGEYFNCVVDIPTGHDLTAEVIMVDDVILDEVQAEQYFSVQYKYFWTESSKHSYRTIQALTNAFFV